MRFCVNYIDDLVKVVCCKTTGLFEFIVADDQQLQFFDLLSLSRVYLEFIAFGCRWQKLLEWKNLTVTRDISVSRQYFTVFHSDCFIVGVYDQFSNSGVVVGRALFLHCFIRNVTIVSFGNMLCGWDSLGNMYVCMFRDVNFCWNQLLLWFMT